MDRAASRSFHTLDAMRGVAAFAVVCFHLRPGWFPSAYLAVDLFFVLSGFVLAHAYDERFAAGLHWRQFFVGRLVRLWPLYALGVVLSIIVQLSLPNATVPLLQDAPLQLAFIPAPGSGRAPLYPLNIPAWTLLFELLINLVWAVAWRVLHSWRLVGAIAVAGIALLLTIITTGSADAGSFWNTAIGGLPRVAFSFLVGVGLCRWRPPLLRRDAWIALGLVALVAAVLLVGVTGAARPLYDAAVVLILSPAIVLAGSFLEPSVGLVALFRFLGLMSYPIYAVHDPLVPLFGEIAKRLRLPFAVEHIAFLGCAMPLALALALTYDPWTRRLLSPRPPRSTSA